MFEFEKIRDEIEKKIVEAQRIIRVKKEIDCPSIYTRRDFGIKAEHMIEQASDGGVTDHEINKVFAKVGWSAENQKTFKEKVAMEVLIEKFLSRGYYGYAKLMKMLGRPISPKFRWWNFRYFHPIMAFINPGGYVAFREGIYVVNSTLSFGGKAIWVDGEGKGGNAAVPASSPVTMFQATSSLTGWMFDPGTTLAWGSKITNVHLDGNDLTQPLGGIYWRNVLGGAIADVGINDFFRTTTGSEARGIKLYDDVGGCWYNYILNPFNRRNTIGIEFTRHANANQIIGGYISNTRDITAYGMYFNAPAGADTNLIMGTDLCDFRQASTLALYFKDAGEWNTFVLPRFEWNYRSIRIDSGVNNQRFFAPSIVNIDPESIGGGYGVSDLGSNNHFVPGKLLENQTVNTSSTTIAHGMLDGLIPNRIDVTPRSDARVWRSAAPNATNIYLQASSQCQCDIYVTRG